MNYENLKPFEQFDRDYEDMLANLRVYPKTDIPEDYIPIVIPPESNEVPETRVRSNTLKRALWYSKTGTMKIVNMEDYHLNNTLQMLKRNLHKYPENEVMINLMEEELLFREWERETN